MINDIETLTTVSIKGILETDLTEADKLKIEKQKDKYLGIFYTMLSTEFKNANYHSEKLALLDMMNELNHPLINQHLSDYVKH